MSWAIAAQIGLGALSGFLGGQTSAFNARQQQANQYTQSLLQTQREIRGLQQGMEVQSKNNNAIAKADIQSLINANYMQGLLNVQRATQKTIAAQAVSDVGKARIDALSQAQVASAASGTIGASVNAVASDIENKAGQAVLDIGDNWANQEFNFETQVRNLYEGYKQGQQGIDTSVANLPQLPSSPNYVSPPSLGSSILAAGLNTAGSYLGNYITLGLGTRSTMAPIEDRSVNFRS